MNGKYDWQNIKKWITLFAEYNDCFILVANAKKVNKTDTFYKSHVYSLTVTRLNFERCHTIYSMTSGEVWVNVFYHVKEFEMIKETFYNLIANVPKYNI